MNEHLGLLNQYPYTQVAVNSGPTKNDMGTWLPWIKVSKKEEITDIGGFPNQLRIELDGKTLEESKTIFEKQIRPVLESQGWFARVYESGNKSIHCEVFFSDLETKPEKERDAIRKAIVTQYWPDLLEKKVIDPQVLQEWHLCRMVGKSHPKTKKPKVLWAHFGTTPTKHPEVTLPLPAQELPIVRPATKKPIPKPIEALIASGVPEGKRHTTRFKIFSKLFEAGFSNEEILQSILYFNQRCQPPAQQQEAEYHVNYLLKHPKYLREKKQSVNELIAKPVITRTQKVVANASNYLIIKKETSTKEYLGGVLTDNVQVMELPIPVYSFRDLSKIKPDRRYFLEGVLFPQSIVMLYSPSSGFKSCTGGYLLLCLSTGKEFLGLKTKKVPVLLCDHENNHRILRDRLEMLAKGMGLKRKNMPFHSIIRYGNLDDKDYVNALIDLIKQLEVKVVMFDTIRRFSNYKENSADDLNRLYLDSLQRIVDECNCCILFLHHSGKDKSQRYRGSSDIFAQVDGVIRIERAEGTTQFKIINEKNRLGEVEEIGGEFVFSEDKIQVFSRTIEPSEKKGAARNKFKWCCGIICRLFPITGHSLKRDEITTHFAMLPEEDAEVSTKTIGRALDWLVKENYLENPRKGVYIRIGDAYSDRFLKDLTKKETVTESPKPQNPENEQNKPKGIGQGTRQELDKVFVPKMGNNGTKDRTKGTTESSPLSSPVPSLEEIPLNNNIGKWQRVRAVPSQIFPCSTCGELVLPVWMNAKTGQCICKNCDLPDGAVRAEAVAEHG